MSEQIQETVTVKASREKVFKALTDANELMRWFPSDVKSDPRPGGQFRYEWKFQDESQNGLQEGRYLDVEKYDKIRYPWEAGPLATEVEFDLTQTDDGTRVDLMHSGWQPDPESEEIRQMHARVWGGYLNNLKLYLEEGGDQRSAMMDQITK
jgi:uncharacterized protein YndB with AHSA1/START domain